MYHDAELQQIKVAVSSAWMQIFETIQWVKWWKAIISDLIPAATNCRNQISRTLLKLNATQNFYMVCSSIRHKKKGEGQWPLHLSVASNICAFPVRWQNVWGMSYKPLGSTRQSMQPSIKILQYLLQYFVCLRYALPTSCNLTVDILKTSGGKCMQIKNNTCINTYLKILLIT